MKHLVLGARGMVVYLASGGNQTLDKGACYPHSYLCYLQTVDCPLVYQGLEDAQFPDSKVASLLLVNGFILDRHPRGLGDRLIIKNTFHVEKKKKKSRSV